MRSAPVLTETMPRGIRFAYCALDTSSGELKKRGVRVRLQYQPFQVLLMLLQRPGEVLSRDELTAQLWPQGTYVDFEHGLNAAVKRLRAAIGDCAGRPRFIETVPRRGYRFIAPVEPIDSSSGAECSAACSWREPGQRPRVAVVRFSGIGDTQAESDFQEGLAEALVTRLRRAASQFVRVVARAASRVVERDARTVRHIGHALRARYIVTGCVRHNHERVRITAELIDARDETQLWADAYEQPIPDLLATECQVAAEIASAVALILRPNSLGQQRHPALVASL